MSSFYGGGGGNGSSTPTPIENVTNIYICGQNEYDSQTGLPTIVNPDENTFYLVPSGSLDNNNLFNEYIYKNSQWELFGSNITNVQTGLQNLVDGSAIGSVRGINTAVQDSNYTMGLNALAEGAHTKASGNQSHAEGSTTTASGNNSHTEGGSTTASGAQSHAEGGGTTASGSQSHAEGGGTTASGTNSHAEGVNTTASGDYSHTEGGGTIASGNNSHAEGGGTIASGDFSHTEGETGNNFSKTINNVTYTQAGAYGQVSHNEGLNNLAIGDHSHTEGGGTIASGINSHAEGAGTTASSMCSHAEGSTTIASGNDSHAEGAYTTASGGQSHAEGAETTASGSQSHAEGYHTTASGHLSHAEGERTIASGNDSHTEGYRTIANHRSQHVFGECNIEDSSSANNDARGNYVEIVGNGTSTSNRSNARTLDWNGNQVLAGKLTVGSGPTNNMDVATKQYVDEHAGSGGSGLQNLVDGSAAGSVRGINAATQSGNYTMGSNAFAEGADTKASGPQSHAEGGGTISSGNCSHAEGAGTTASGADSHAEGVATTASGSYSHAEGQSTIASNNDSHAEGAVTTASGAHTHAEGQSTTASGNTSHAEGFGTIASGIKSHAEGQSSNAFSSITINNITYTQAGAYGEVSHSEGSNTLAIGNYSHAEGDSTIASGVESHAEGLGAKASGDRSHAEGVSTIASGNNSHAEGGSTTASGTYSHAEGSGTTSSGSYSHAEGTDTTASNIGSHAEGSGTTASGTHTHAEGANTTASGSLSHAEGQNTIANHKSQHVFGEFNIEDSSSALNTARGNYVEIVGNGTSTSNRSNARTLDWSGNQVLAGKLTVGSGPTNNMDVATKQYVDNNLVVIQNRIKNRWEGKTIVFFGDSRTWYDDQNYTSSTKSEWVGKKCKGYQKTVAQYLGCTCINEGINGATSIGIGDAIRAYDFSNINAVFIEGGVNDFILKSQITIGEIQPEGSTFNTETSYGAWQSALEYIMINYPQVKIFIDVPAIAWSGGMLFPYTIAKIKKDVAELYNIPCLNLYKQAGINIQNRSYYYADDSTLSSQLYLHFNDNGNTIIGEIIASFINSK